MKMGDDPHTPALRRDHRPPTTEGRATPRIADKEILGDWHRLFSLYGIKQDAMKYGGYKRHTYSNGVLWRLQTP